MGGGWVVVVGTSLSAVVVWKMVFLRGEQVEPIEPKISTKVARVDNGIYDP